MKLRDVELARYVVSTFANRLFEIYEIEKLERRTFAKFRAESRAEVKGLVKGKDDSVNDHPICYLKSKTLAGWRGFQPTFQGHGWPPRARVYKSNRWSTKKSDPKPVRIS